MSLCWACLWAACRLMAILSGVCLVLQPQSRQRLPLPTGKAKPETHSRVLQERKQTGKTMLRTIFNPFKPRGKP